ncbi:MAG: PQQ-binding-like beta-propeller repeat protein [Acidimicrobiia bacterium]|nr:PQQ-binding-like beta-propeller repeat protein [Acidimicrobiia bacterium]
MSSPLTASALPASPTLPLPGACTTTDWPMFGHDPGRSFSSSDSCIGTAGAATLRPKWFFNASSPVTAQPAVAGGTVYAGDMAGVFHAINAADGSEKWNFNAHACAAGKSCDNDISDYGTFTDSAAVTRIGNQGRQVVVVGGGATLFVLDAATGHQVSALCLDRVDPTCQGHSGYTTEIEASPVVVGAGNGAVDVLVGTDVNEHNPSGPTGLYDITLRPDGSLTPKWMFDPETGATVSGLPPLQAKPGTEHGCGDVWSSPSVAGDLVTFGVGNCDHPDQVKSSTVKLVEGTFALHLNNGTVAWQATPHAPYTCTAQGSCTGLDLDFGATPNALTGIPGTAVTGEGGKDGVYYAYKRDGSLSWKTTVATASDYGGMIGSTAVGKLGLLHGNHPAIFAATAIPVHTSDVQGSLTNDAEHPTQAFGVHAIDAVTHQVVWDAPVGPAFGAAVYDNGVVYVPDTTNFSLMAFDADTGALLRVQPTGVPPSSPVAVSGNSLYMGAGTFVDGAGGVWGFQTTP